MVLFIGLCFDFNPNGNFADMVTIIFEADGGGDVKGTQRGQRMGKAYCKSNIIVLC